MNFEQGLQALAQNGLNLVAWVPAAQAPENTALQLDDGQGVLLLLARGRKFADHALAMGGSDPFDQESARLAQQFADQVIDDPHVVLLYPGNTPIDLRHWMQLARLNYPSPLGTGIRPDCGPWFAVRAALRCRLAPEQVEILQQYNPPLPDGPGPCDTCETKPCRSACPAEAIRADAPDLAACMHHRLKPQSSCEDRCLARLACPVGTDWRYSEPQQAHHYLSALATIRKWGQGDSS